MFELTTQEKNTINDFITELSELAIILMKEGVWTSDPCEINIFDIIEKYLEGQEKNRGTLFRSSILQVSNESEKIVIQGNIDDTSLEFLTNLVNQQIEFITKNFPASIESFNKKQQEASSVKEITDLPLRSI